MRRITLILVATLTALILADIAVALGLGWIDARFGPGHALVRYFEYGRSAPGKIERWTRRRDDPANLFDVAWTDDTVAYSAEAFAAESQASTPTVRVYGMSFSDNIVAAARRLDDRFRADTHGGPGAPPNWVYAMFEADAANRRPGDWVVMAVLGSAVVRSASLSNRTGVFEQPAPATYPSFRVEGDGLRRVDPLVASAAEERALASDPARAAAWARQLREVDPLWTAEAFAAPWLDNSPFLRLVRRSMATTAVNRAKADYLVTGEPVEATRRLLARFVAEARAEGLRPFVLLIQNQRAGHDLLAEYGPGLAAMGAPFLATAEIADPTDLSQFASDGHFTAAADQRFAERFLEMLAD